MKKMLIKPVKVHFLKNLFFTRIDRKLSEWEWHVVSAEEETKSTLRIIDLKNKLLEKFDDKLKFMNSS